MTHGESGKPPPDLTVHLRNSYVLAVNTHTETTIMLVRGKIDCLAPSTAPQAPQILWELSMT